MIVRPKNRSLLFYEIVKSLTWLKLSNSDAAISAPQCSYNQYQC